MSVFDPTEHQHTRWNPLKSEWVLVCPHRMKRPWSGQLEKAQEQELPDFDPKNPLCPGVTRPNGKKNPDYRSTYVFTNDFPALLEDVPAPMQEETGPESDLFRAEAAKGTCRVMCFHPKSNVTLPVMTHEEICTIVAEWKKQFAELGAKYKWVQIFENKGAVMGCSNPHPHCQIWASSFIPNEASIKDKNLKAYYEKHSRNMLMEYAKQEVQKKERLICENVDFIAVVPYWAFWPFEAMILPRDHLHISRMSALTEQQEKSLADIIKQLTIRYDNLFEVSFPYSMGFHGAPTGPGHTNSDEASTYWQFHALYYPPLLRSATVKKFMVGYEMLSNVQRDLTAEQAAKRLRELSNKHYKKS